MKDLWKSIADFIEDHFGNTGEEFVDFVEDSFEHLFKKKKFKIKKLKKINLYGTLLSVRPAYAFAERVENLLKLIFGFSILISAIYSSFWGFTRTSELLEYLISSLFGRLFMIIIGSSYLIIGIWKTVHLRKKS